MSGIFGLSVSCSRQVEPLFAALEKENRCYGREPGDSLRGDRFAVGCYPDHFSDSIRCGAPVLRQGQAVAVIDALLYNREELLPLTSLDAAAADEELLFHLLLENGPEVLLKVNGDFAGAVYFQQENKWLLFRDHTGVRPLYVYRKDDLFAFSTDMRGLLQMPGADLALDETQLYLRIMGGNVNSAHATDFAYIRMLKAGHTLVIQPPDGGQEMPYYLPDSKKRRFLSRRACEKQLYQLVEDAVRRRLAAIDVPIGAELSGGLDSGVVDVMIHRSGRQARYLSWSPPPDLYPLQAEDERLLVQALCRQEGITCDYLPPDEAETERLFREKWPPFVHSPQVGRTADWMRSQGVRVVFSGHGGDEGVSHRSGPLELWHHGEHLAYAGEVMHRLKGRKWRLAKTAVHMLKQKKAGKNYIVPWHCKGGMQKNLLAADFYRRMQDTPFPPLCFGYAPAEFVRQGGQRARVDNAAFQAAAHGVRYVFPLMDHRLLSFALEIPRRMYLKKGRDRLIFRRAFACILPPEVTWQTRKDSPGISSVHIPQRAETYRRYAAHMLQELDRNRWSAYWNMDVVLGAKDSLDTADCPLNVRNVNDLFLCRLIQKWQDGGWADE